TTRHELERAFDVTSRELLEIIATRRRLAVAVRGGVAEHHLQTRLDRDRNVVKADLIEKDGEPDFKVQLKSRTRPVFVECKNVSPKKRADGSYKVEVQKTRASKGDPASRLYRVD